MSNIDYLDPDVPLADVALHLSGRLDEMREDLNHQGEVATRYEEALTGLSWVVSRLRGDPDYGFRGVPVMAVLELLDEIVVYANLGEAKMPAWLAHARREMGRAG